MCVISVAHSLRSVHVSQAWFQVSVLRSSSDVSSSPAISSLVNSSIYPLQVLCWRFSGVVRGAWLLGTLSQAGYTIFCILFLQGI